MPTLDVVVPCYNYARFLERCVKSVLTQEGADVRILIIDDCSTDDSALVGQRLASADARVEFRRHEQNLGHIATYNEGLIGWAKAEYSLLLSADDALLPGAFKRALTLFESSPDVGLVYGMARIITRDDEFQSPTGSGPTSPQIIPGREFLRLCCVRCCNPVPTATAIVRTALQQRLGGYRSDLPHTGDLEMWMRFALQGSIGIVRSVQGEYRVHGRNMSSQYYTRILNDRNEFEVTCRDVLNSISAADVDAGHWLSSMHSRMLAEAEQHALNAFDHGNIEAYEAWDGFAQKIAGRLTGPRRSRRLAIRKLLGPRAWQSLRRARRAFNRSLPEAQPLNTSWTPSHGDIIGDWPA
jgi:glycosyltransferase involved in cell wall biosynthesis